MSEPATKKLPSPWRRRLLRGFVVLSLLLTSLLFGGMWWLSSPSGEGWLRDRIQAALDEALVGGTAEVGVVRSNGWTQFSLEGLHIRENGEPVLTASNLEVEYRIWGLLSGHLNVLEADISRVHAALVREEDGRLNIERLFTPEVKTEDGGGLPVSIGIRDFEIGELSVSLRAGEQRVLLEKAGVGARVEAEAGEWRLRKLEIEGLLEEKAVELECERILLGDTFSMSGLEAKWQESVVSMDVNTRAQGLLIDVTSSEVALAPLGKLLGVDLEERSALQGQVWQEGEGWNVDLETSLLGGRADLTLSTLGDQGQGRVLFEAVQAHRVLADLGPETLLSGQMLLDPSPLEHPEFRLELGPTLVRGHDLEQAQAHFFVQEDGIELASLSIRHDSGLVTAEGFLQEQVFEGQVSTQVTRLSALRDIGVKGLSGWASLQGFMRVDWSSSPLANFQGTASGRRLLLPGGLALGQVQGPVRATLREGQIHADGGFKGADGEAMQGEVGSLFGAWQVDLAPETEPVWEVDLEAADLLHSSLRLQGLSGSFRGEGGQILGGADLSGLAVSEMDWVEGRLDLEEVPGELGFALELTDGEGEKWMTRAQVDPGGKGLSVDELVLSPKGGVWTLAEPAQLLFKEGSGLYLEMAALRGPSGGRIELGASGKQGRLVLNDVPLEALDSFGADSGHKGHLSGELELLDGVEGPRLNGKLSGKRIVVPGQVNGVRLEMGLLPVGMGERVEFLLARGKKTLAEGSVLVPLQTASGLPDLDWSGPIKGKVRVEAVDNRLWRKIFPKIPELPRGFSAGELRLAGTPRRPQLELETGVEWMLGSGPEFVRADLFLQHEADSLSGRGTVRQAGRPLAEWKGTIQTGLLETLSWMAGDGPSPPIHHWDHWWQDGQVRVLSKGMDLRALRPLLPFQLPLEGRLSGSFLVEGKPSQPWVLAGLSLADGRLGDVEVPMATLSVNPDDSGYAVFAYGKLDEESMQVDGRVNLDLSSPRLLREKLLDEAVDLKVAGAIPLAVAGAWSESIENAKGAVAVNGQIGGSVRAPEPDLRLALKHGGLDWTPEALRLEDFSFEGRVTPAGLNIPRFTVKSEPKESRGGLDFREHESLFSGSLLLPMDPDGAAALELLAKDAWLSSRPDRVLRVDGGLSAEGPLEAMQVEGRFQVNESRVVMSAQDWLAEDALSLDPGIQLHRRVEVMDAAEEGPSLWSGWTYGLDIDLGQNSWVEADVPLTDTYGLVASKVSTVGLMGRLDGVVRAETQDGELGLLGEVDIRKGKAEVFGTDFDVETGRLLFSGAAISSPVVDIGAVYPSSQYGEIRVDIQGQPANLQLGFSSSEGWSDTDMAAILLFKRPASSMTQSEGGAGLDVLGAAIGVMAGQASQFLRMSRLVDLVEVESSGEAISAIRLGWSIGDDLFLTYSQDYTAEADENTSAVTLEWLLSRRLQAELSTGDAGESAADLYLRWRF